MKSWDNGCIWGLAFNSLTYAGYTTQKKMGNASFCMLSILDRLPADLFWRAQGFASELKRMESLSEALRKWGYLPVEETAYQFSFLP